MPTVVILFVCALTAWLLTAGIRHYTRASGVMDQPTARSSHTRPTPRGGGVAIAVVVAVGLSLLGLWLPTQGPVLATLVAGGLALTLVGWVDDRYGLRARWRLLVHLLAALAVAVVAGPPALPMPGDWPLLTGVLGTLVTAVGLAWLINLYNFMDGIDALAAVEAITASATAAVLLVWLGRYEWAMAAGMVAAATTGFLAWNWPPARIFLGDAGSGFLGFTLGGLAVVTSSYGPLNAWAWLILLGVFIVDATLTLARRAWRGERLHLAHRSHAYQHAAQRLGRHGPVAAAAGALNLGWLAPLAWLATSFPSWGVLVTAVAWAPLACMGVYLRAGQPAQ